MSSVRLLSDKPDLEECVRKDRLEEIDPAELVKFPMNLVAQITELSQNKELHRKLAFHASEIHKQAIKKSGYLILLFAVGSCC